MYKKISADKDTYITNKFVNSKQAISSNLGAAGTLDLYKIHGANIVNGMPQNEVSRILMHFDLEGLKKDVKENNLDINDKSFFCKLYLRDVYGGQPTPSNFTIDVFPLSASFDEGFGKDVVKYSDRGLSNWLTASYEKPWALTGSSKGGGSTEICDFITGSTVLATTTSSCYFKTGTEDLIVDVTKIVSSTISGELPDSGFRLSFTSAAEEDKKTYFVKRFASRHAYDETKHPKLAYGYDDSVFDDTLNLSLDKSCSISLYNFSQGEMANIISSSTQITGENCVLLKLSTNNPSGSSGDYALYFTGSQSSRGDAYLSGSYYAEFIVNNDETIRKKFIESSSVKFEASWLSLDSKLTYSSGDLIFFNSNSSQMSHNDKKYIVSVLGLQDSYSDKEVATLRVNIFDSTNPLVKIAKMPIESPNVVLRNSHYSIRDAITNEIVVPKDEINNSTKLSSDNKGMFFKLYLSALPIGRTYVVDVHTEAYGVKKVHQNASQIFKVVK